MSNPRKAISKGTRFKVFDRDGFTCQYCGQQPPDVTLHVDHIFPVSKGGTNDIDNLSTSCMDCNGGKGATPLTNDAGSERDRLRRAQEALEATELAKAAVKASKSREEVRQIAVNAICEATGNDQCASRNATTIVNLMGEFGPDKVFKWMDIAASTVTGSRSKREENIIRYMCGIAKNIRKESQ
tara:strand:- start:5107 stop:5658 length:552 start_codon:yes stop_codon:yes gene_type:complete